MNGIATQPTKVQIADLQADERLQVREAINPKVVRDYYDSAEDAWADESKWPFPPIEVRLIDDVLYVVDGWYRIQVAQKLGMQEVPCNVVDASWPAAILAAAAANAKHGVPLTARERRRAVRMVLSMDADLSDRSVAHLVGVSPSTVSNVRDALADAGEMKNSGERIGIDGKTYPVKQRLRPRDKRSSEINGAIGQVSRMDTSQSDERTETSEASDSTEPYEPDERGEVQIIVSSFCASAKRLEILVGIFMELNSMETKYALTFLKNLSGHGRRRKTNKVKPTGLSEMRRLPGH